MKYTATILLFLLFFNLRAQEKIQKKAKIQHVAALQLWSTYTFGTEIFNEETQSYEVADNRLNTQLRRSRLGFTGQVTDNVRFDLTTAIDLVGKDDLAGTEGTGNNGGSPNLRLWNAFVQWKMDAKSAAFNLTAGYMPPQIGRESITPAFKVSSMEKSWSQNYMRRHLVGTGAGRTMGINIGGLTGKTDKGYRFKYDLGIFNATNVAYSGHSAGQKASPLFVGKLVTYFGEPENKKYTTSHQINYFGERDGLSISLSGASQGENDLYKGNYAAGADFLWNKGNFNFDGEWTLMWRTGIDPITNGLLKSKSNTGYLRLSYNFYLHDKYIIEPVIMVMQFQGEKSIEGQSKAHALACPSGQEQKADIGFNVYLNSNFKLSLHYTLRAADAGTEDIGATVNNYFYQANIGAIKRGDWLGVGVAVAL